MKYKKPILIAATVIGAFGILFGGVALVIKRNEGAKTPMGWCVERIKEKNMFDENHVTGFAYSGNKIRNEYPNDWNETYFVEVVYSDCNGDWYEKWVCGISYERTIWQYLKEDQIIEIGCDRLTREEI